MKLTENEVLLDEAMQMISFMPGPILYGSSYIKKQWKEKVGIVNGLMRKKPLNAKKLKQAMSELRRIR